MRATRDLAARYGALVTVAVMDLSLADMALMAFNRDGCLAAARACAVACAQPAALRAASTAFRTSFRFPWPTSPSRPPPAATTSRL